MLAPALSALLGPRLLAALAATAAAALFTSLVKARFPARAARLGALWFAFGVGAELLSGRVPFELGLALGLGALLAGVRARTSAACVLAGLSALASPVAGAFVALAALAWAMGNAGIGIGGKFTEGGGAPRRTPRAPVWRALALGIAALLPIVALAVVFPEGGSEPFAASAFWPALAASLLFALALPHAALVPPHDRRVLRAGTLLYALALAGAFVISTPVGGNAVRLGALTAGPLAIAALSDGLASGGRARGLLLAALPLLLYWQLVAPIRDFAAAAGDPAVGASYYKPLLNHLAALERGTRAADAAGPPGSTAGSLGSPPLRIEVVPTRDHWETRWVAPRFALARGWERQLDRSTDAVFYEAAALTPARYRAWLLNMAVAYVALPDAPLDPSARAEARLLRDAGARAAGLREIWHAHHWRLFAVVGARPLASPPASVTALTSDSLTLAVPRAGEYTVRVHFTPYWALATGRGCVRRAPGAWTAIQARTPGSIRLTIDFALSRIFSRGARCR